MERDSIGVYNKSEIISKTKNNKEKAVSSLLSHIRRIV